MYGIIPTAPPSDLSNGLSSREATPRGDSHGTPFADQLAQLNSHNSDKQRHEEENTAQRNASPAHADASANENATRTRADASDEKRESKNPQRVDSADSESKKGAARAPDDVDFGAESARNSTAQEVGEHTREQQKLTGHFSTEKKRGDGVSDNSEDSEESRISEESRTSEESRIDDQDNLNPVKEAAPKEVRRVSKDMTQHAAEADKVGTEKTVHVKTKETGPGKLENRAATSASDPGTGSPAKGAAATAEPGPEREETAAAGGTDHRTERRKSSAKDSIEGMPGEGLVDRKEQSDASKHDRRVRGVQDPRERRIAAEKAGTRTVDAKAVAPLEGENVTTERTVTREFSVDLSQATVHQSEGSQTSGDENLLAPGRMEVSPGNNASRTPSLSQATQTLARRLNGDLGDNVVRQAKVMMQDANNAELRLVIRPPELGRIRIRLQMDNGHIAGRILVDNGSVREVVEQNLASLQRAFEEAGLDMGELEVSTGDARDEADTNSQEHGGSAPQKTAVGAESFGRSIEMISEYEPGRHRINLVA